MIKVFAHRGAESSRPENTKDAFLYALELGAKAIELDVQLTKDNVPVVIHDYTLTRYNKDYTLPVDNYTYEALSQIDVGSYFSTDYSHLRVPTLSSILEIIPQNVLLNIEIKNTPKRHQGIEKKVADLISEYREIDNTIVSSFDHIALKTISEINPNLKLGFLIHYPMINPGQYVHSTGLNAVSIHPNKNIVNETFIQECKQYGYKIYPYTVKDETDYTRLTELGVDGFFTSTADYY